MNKSKLQFLPFATACAALASWAGGAAASEAYSITGDVSAAYSNGEFVVWVSGSSSGGGGAASMVAAVPASSGGNPHQSIKKSLNILAEAPIVDGRFFLEGVTGAPRNVYFYVLNSVSERGNLMAPMKGTSFVLEPGELTLTMDKRAKFVVRGGHYNDIVVNSWRLSPEYLELSESYYHARKAVEGETEKERRARVDRSGEIFSELLQAEQRGRREVALNHEDPLARKLVLQSIWLWDPWVPEAVRGLAEMTPDDPWVVERLASEERSAANRAKAVAIAVGTEIKDFEAETLDGEVVSVSGAREGKEIVLLEFWASWCGPCRTEIPHMKQAYADYGASGFEIISFTVDDEREDWEQASEEENLPWINAGMGLDHPAAKAYGVTGVPANFLVDAGSGEIVAKNLRGHKLDEALEERLGKADGS